MTKLVLGIIIGFICALALFLLAGYSLILSGIVPARQDEPPSSFEKWAAHQSLKATLNREANMKCIIELDEPNLMAGSKIYAGNCSGCHGTPLSATPAIANGYSPSAPLFADGDTVTDDPPEKIYWKIDHGIRFTGMPSFNKMLTEKEMWQVTLFLKHMDKLPPVVNDSWKQMK